MRSAAVNRRRAKPPCTTALGNRRGSRWGARARSSSRTRADQEGPAESQVVDQAEEVVDEVVVADLRQPGAVVGVLAGDSRRGSSGTARPAG